MSHGRDRYVVRVPVPRDLEDVPAAIQDRERIARHQVEESGFVVCAVARVRDPGHALWIEVQGEYRP
jgi:hypothetical protein